MVEREGGMMVLGGIGMRWRSRWRVGLEWKGWRCLRLRVEWMVYS